MAGNNKKSSKAAKSKALKDTDAEATLAAVKTLPADQQLNALLGHFTDLASQNVSLKNSLTVSEKSKDQLNIDYTKAMLSKGQLESLCRELQKQNKVTKEENLARIREEEEKRREVSTRLNATLADITGLMQQNTEKNTELRQENQDMAGKLQELVTHYDARQEHIDQILRQRELQIQLAEAKLAKASFEAAEDKETFLREKKKMLTDLQAYQEKISRMSETEIALRTQLGKFADQYDQFQKTIESSNLIMNKFKEEMEGMTKKIKKLERETQMWQTKWQKSNKTLIDMVSERADLIYKCEKLGKQNIKLQQLGRTLQSTLVEERKQKQEIDSAADDATESLEEAIEQMPIETVKVEPSLSEVPILNFDSKEGTPDPTTASDVTPANTTQTDGATAATDGATTATDGATAVKDGASAATDGATTATDGATAVTDGASAATDGATTDTDGSPPATDGASSIANEASKAAGGVMNGLADIQSRLALLKCSVNQTSQETKQETVQITEL